MLALRVGAFDSEVAEALRDNLVVSSWNDCVAHSRVDDGVAGFDAREVSVLALGVGQAGSRHAKGPIMLILVHVAPENIFLRRAWFGVLGQVVATEGDTSILIGRLAQEHAEHGLKGVLLAELVDLVQLLHETLKVPLRARRRQSDDAGKPIILHAGGLIRLQNLHILDARRLVALLKANLHLVLEAIDVAGAIAVLDSAHQRLVQL